LPTPEEYASFVKQIELLEVWLVDARVENRYGPRTPRRTAIGIASPPPTWRDTDDGFEVEFPYSVRFTQGEDVEAEIAVTFGLRFTSSQPMSQGTFEVFKEVNLPVNTWPFLREFVSTTLGRMGWQAFTLPAYKQGVPDEDDLDEDKPAPPRRRRTASRKRS